MIYRVGSNTFTKEESMKITYLFGLTLFAIAGLSVSCQNRNFTAGSDTLHDTRNTAGIPTPRPEPGRVNDVVLGSAEDLKVLAVQAASKPIRTFNQKDCQATNNGSHSSTQVDCAPMVANVSREIGFDGLHVQSFSFNSYYGEAAWNFSCRPIRIRLQMDADLLSKAQDGIGFHINSVGLNGCNPKNDKQCRIANSKIVPRDEILQRGTRKGNSIEADFLLLGLCGSNKVEFKPFIADGLTHSWEAFQGNHIAE
jgi:hypothetical protein